MRIGSRKQWHWCVVAVALSVFPLRAQQPQRVDDNALRDAGKSGEWLTTGVDYAETRYSRLDQINASNVQNVGLAWFYDVKSEPGALEATPIVWNGTVYTTLTWDVVIAVDIRTGKLKWRYDPKIPHQNFPPNSREDPNRVRTGPTILAAVNRGVALYDGKIYVGLLDGRLIALDAQDGKVVWEAQTTDPNSDLSITGAPRVVGGKVVIGNAGGEFATRGYVTAYDAESGKQIWRFYTTPGDPSKPYENEAMKRAAKTWTGDVYWKLGGGGNVWDAFAYDPDLDLIYFGTGNGGPWSRDWRSPHGGDNLYDSSIIALHARTGDFAWYFQETPGEEWDYDATADLILADLKVNGKLQKVIMQASKNGFFYILDRKTGKFLSAKPFGFLNWATGVNPKTGRPIEASNARYDSKGSVLSPATGGVHGWPTMSFNPKTGLVYIPGMTSSFFYAEDRSKFSYQLGQYNRGINATPWGTTQDLDPNTPIPKRETPPMPPGAPPRGNFLEAWDPVTQTKRWQTPDVGASTMTTAGNLVFAGSNDGHFAAYSADEGKKLWEVKLAPGFGSPVTYMLDGRQYISILAGRAGDGKLYTFMLNGHAAMPAARTPVPKGKTTENAVYSESQAERGKVQYLQNCAKCHMSDLSGNDVAPALVGDSFMQTWSGHTADELFGRIRTTMPQDNPNSLQAGAYTDILAYIFQANLFPAGPDDLNNPALRETTIQGAP